MTQIWSKEWFDGCFDGIELPADIRTAAERVVRAYGIRGVADPGYIANVIAKETGRGDGCSNFADRRRLALEAIANYEMDSETDPRTALALCIAIAKSEIR